MQKQKYRTIKSLILNFFMRKLVLLLVAIIALTGLTTEVIAQVTLTGNAAGAELVTALTITNTTAMHFGVIAIPTAGGSVKMGTNGTRTPTGAGLSIVQSGTVKTVAKFDLTGTVGDTYSFTLPSSISVTTDGGGATKSMTIDNFVVKVDAAAETPYGSIGTCTLTGGASSILVGGTLNIGSSQVLGIYSGLYQVVVDYL